MSTPPRLIRPNATYLVTRRVEGRRFLLRPDQAFNRLFLYVLTHRLNRHGIELHAVVVMSDHYHLVISVPDENVSDLMRELNETLSKAIKVLRPHARGVVWEPGGLGITELHGVDAIVHEIAYCIVNPVKAGLVYRPEDWPGVLTQVAQLGRTTLGAARPGYYFTGKDTWDEDASVGVRLPASVVEHYGDADRAREAVAIEVERQLEEARAHVKAQGWNVLGVIGVKNASPYQHARSDETSGGRRPHLATGPGQVALRFEKIRELKAFRRAYRAALTRWCAGERDVEFPAGTYWMRVHHGVRVAPFG